MPENIGGPSAPFNTRIPSITDNADIQTALRLYHYGSDTSAPTTVPQNSIAGHFSVIQNAKIDKTPVLITSQENPDMFEETGYYVQVSNQSADENPNYPAPYAGLLTVVNSGDLVFQQYQVVGAQEPDTGINAENRSYWRFKYYDSSQQSLEWGEWRTFLEAGEFTAQGDQRYVRTAGAETFISNYYTKSLSDQKFLTIEEGNQFKYVTENVVSGSSYTLQYSDISKVIAVDSAADFTITIPLDFNVPFPNGTLINIYALNTHKVSVQGATGVTVRPFANNRFKLFDQYAEISIRKRATNEWVAAGNILED